MLKVKLKESALVNVNRLDVLSKSIHLGVNWYTLRIVNAVSAWLSGNRLTGDLSGKYRVVQQEIHLFSATNYTANLYSATILLMS